MSMSTKDAATNARAAGAPRDEFIAAMGRVATGVTVVSTGGPAGRFAQTVSAMCSVSADPRLVLVCINARSPINAAIREHGVFNVNVLGKQHDHVADTFAGRPWPGKERWDFSCGEWVDAPSGSPRIRDAVASFDCTVHETVEAGTHLVYIGRVTSVDSHEAEPLIYSAQTYAKPEPIEPSVFPDYPGSGPTYRQQKKEDSQ
ncbi:flavin reductase family protein [Arthrobacter sp. I2-34]|uniref:Flavin reductase family protein n=1 Tax=Arthrobacter hankyongi TaxID=2904801 RepID=A0ABS9L760_9MICC|nr:flavin reductase family protein [Arthrobacter hankyongi]MCG2622510.1 flavin reductase family protein [Arthrobacter hankyongi]